MKDSYETKILKFKRIFSLLPPSERDLPIVKLDKKIFTWREVYKEIVKKTELSEKLLKEMEEVGLI